MAQQPLREMQKKPVPLPVSFQTFQAPSHQLHQIHDWTSFRCRWCGRDFISLFAIREGRIPPTLNLDRLDPACEALRLDFTPNHSVEKRLDYALSNSFGFGGTNASLIVGRV
jgi:hypothetical protein